MPNSSRKATTIVLADDHEFTRQGVRDLLHTIPGFSVVGEARSGPEAVALVERWAPDVAILDISMPGFNGLEAARQIVQRSPGTRVVILSMHDDEARALEALRVGIMAYVLKSAPTDTLVYAIQEALGGRHYLSPPLSGRAMDDYAARAAGRSLDPYDRLTMREREAVHLRAAGLTYAQIAGQMAISCRTAEHHVTNAMRKLGLQTSRELVRYDLQRDRVN